MSYLVYPDFDRVGHPALAEAFIADLSRLNLRHRDYSRTENPPILHRKEFLVPDEYPRRSLFARLSDREAKLGLFDTHQPIGTRQSWHAVLAARHLSIHGHEIVSQVQHSTMN